MKHDWVRLSDDGWWRCQNCCWTWHSPSEPSNDLQMGKSGHSFNYDQVSYNYSTFVRRNGLNCADILVRRLMES